MTGITPGPKMMSENLPLTFALLIGIAVANGIAGIVCFFAAPQLIKVAKIHIDFMFVIVLVMVFIGTFVTVFSMSNIIVAIIFGFVGFFMKRLDYSRPALILGFVLGELFETYFWRSFKIFGPTFFVTPGSLTMIAIIIGIFIYPSLKKLFRQRFRKEARVE